MIRQYYIVKKLLIISGSTATGKTALGIKLAKMINGEMVSFDSRQAYRHLDIVTGKEVNDKIPIWLYDSADPKEYINAYEFCQTAAIVIDDIVKRGKMPIIVGGSVFYIKTFLEGLPIHGIGPNWKLRNILEKQTVAHLQEKLIVLNAARFAAMNNSDKNNKRRLIRAIEIAQGKRPKAKGERQKDTKYQTLFVGLIADKQQLKTNIERRVRERIKKGAVAEVEQLLCCGYRFDDPGLQTIGYKQLRDYFEKKTSLEDAVNAWVRAEIAYTKRQLVFLKKLPSVHLFNSKDTLLVEKIEQLKYK